MDRREAGAGGESHVKGGDIAEPDQKLWIAADQVEIEIGEDARGSPAAANREDRADFIVGEHGVDVCGAVAVLSGKAAIAGEEMPGGLRNEAHLGDRFLDEIEIDRQSVG